MDTADENCQKQSATPASTPISLEGPIKQRNVHDALAKSQEFDKQNNCFHSSTKLHCGEKCPTRVVMIPDLKSKIHDLEEHFNEGFIKEYEVIDEFCFHLKSVNYALFLECSFCFSSDTFIYTQLY